MRIKENFDNGWKFHQGDIPIMNAVKSGMTGGLTDCKEIEEGEWLKIAFFDERTPEPEDWSGWKDVQIPHDWCVETDYIHNEGDSKYHILHGYLKAEVGCYRKVFAVPEEWRGRKIRLELEGIFRSSTIWVIGHKLIYHESGYTGFSCDMTDVLRYGAQGKNVIFIRVDPTEYEGWWYEGAGIYRHTWLVVTDRLHIKRHGTVITTPEVDCSLAEVQVKSSIIKESSGNQSWEAKIEIRDSTGALLGSSKSMGNIESYSDEVCTGTFSVAAPQLWTPETPYLYSASISIYSNGCLVDSETISFGIRTVAFDPDRGFLLNGVPYVIKGVCCHQDFAGVGVALPDSLIEYKLKLLKEMGCNAYRSAHHPSSPWLLECCDRMGFLVMDENRKLDSSQKGIEDLKEMLYRGRNHPSIFMWSMENEEILEGTVMGTQILQTLTDITHKIDPYRPVCAAMNHGWNDGGYSNVLDVVGYNYGQRGDQDMKDHLLYPGRCMIGSESASHTVTRGCYERDDEKGYCPEYGTHIPRWGCSTEKAWSDVKNNPFLSGIFIWTGFDYRGETTPYVWPNINSHFGVMDTCGFPKDNYYYLSSQWTENPVLHIMPYWNWPGHEGCMKEVWIYTNCQEVELFLNEKSLGKKTCTSYGHLEWQVEYEPGCLRADGYDAKGEKIMSACQETEEEAFAVKLTTRKQILQADDCDTACIEVTVVDRQGRLVHQDSPDIFFSIQGPGRILGTGNGNPSSHEPDKACSRKTFAGKALLIAQATDKPGTIVVTAECHNMKTAVCSIECVDMNPME